jgi:hypothetical protein
LPDQPLLSSTITLILKIYNNESTILIDSAPLMMLLAVNLHKFGTPAKTCINVWGDAATLTALFELPIVYSSEFDAALPCGFSGYC